MDSKIKPKITEALGKFQKNFGNLKSRIETIEIIWTLTKCLEKSLTTITQECFKQY